jgi:hypothetical protein
MIGVGFDVNTDAVDVNNAPCRKLTGNNIINEEINITGKVMISPGNAPKIGRNNRVKITSKGNKSAKRNIISW